MTTSEANRQQPNSCAYSASPSRFPQKTPGRAKGFPYLCLTFSCFVNTPSKVQDLGVDMLTLVGHKFGAPKGVAALFVRRGLVLPPLIHGGGQEAGRRAGTENVLLISGMGKAAEVGRACAQVERPLSCMSIE